MNNVCHLAIKESVFLDPHTLKQLYEGFGTERAMSILQEALGLIELHAKEVLLHAQDPPRVFPSLKTIEVLAENLGLVALSLVCSDALDCLNDPQSHSFKAVLARLDRIVRQSPITIRHAG